MAEVFLAALDGPSAFRKHVVLKRVLPFVADDPELVRMFVDEARLVARFRHPNLVQVYELDRVGDEYAIVMEYLEGKSLDEVMHDATTAGRTIPPAVCAAIVSRAASGLAYAHRLRDDDGRIMGIVHRDVSPANLFMTIEGEIKVVDFGIAKHAGATSATEAGKIRGKIFYMSPEQVRAEVLDGRTDIFSLGLVLFELLAGERLFPNLATPLVLEHIATTHSFEPRLQGLAAPQELVRILTRALASDRDRRYATADELATDLDAYLFASRSQVSPTDLRRIVDGAFTGPHVHTAIASEDRRAVPQRLQDPTVALDVREHALLAGGNAERRLRPPRRLRLVGAAVVLVALAVAANAMLGSAPVETSAPPDVSRPTASHEPIATPPVIDDSPAPKSTSLKRAHAETRTGRLVLTASPALQVVLAGVMRGTTPVTIEDMKPGGYDVELRGPGLGSRVVRVQVEAGKATSKHVALAKGRLAVLAQPWADVFIGDRKVGTTPMNVLDLYEGNYRVTLRNPETGKSHEERVQIEAQAMVKIVADLY